jgi:hypothetical protein
VETRLVVEPHKRPHTGYRIKSKSYADVGKAILKSSKLV